ncbi:hypothetical protein [Shewanella pealeana]|uniref:Lipoprotein n=1 Tax=Shewanella pealeana (strain ATCC 700345 / ANG-SQ1) TaxID=398579 RepID=A8GZW9_SHEPA|nr:hypothetical protein [Shewanella pealeana]ABV85856.1 hypothetical protein Spea_0528 [Shewanella pealeana ATCC 700345]
MKFQQVATFIVAISVLVGCNSDSSSDIPLPPSYSSINGLASQGGAIKGVVTLKQSDESRVKSISDLQVFEDGKFVISDATELSYPAIVKITGAHGVKATTEYSIILDNTVERINLSPLTRLMIGRIAGVDAEVVYDKFSDYQHLFTDEALEEAQSELDSLLEPLLSVAKLATDTNFLSAVYLADFEHLDSVLSTLSIEYQHDKATLVYLPAKEFRVELAYGESWKNKSFIPAGSDQAQIKLQLGLINQASNTLEQMILLKDDRVAFDNYLAPNAHWFGSDASTLHDIYFDILPEEDNANLKRYRDFVILDSTPAKQQYLLGFTATFEASTQSSISRDQAWFEFVDGELKFLGDDKPFPTSFYAMYKLNVAPAEYNWVPFKTFEWVFETTGFLSSTHCTPDLERGAWQRNSKEFFDKLANLNDAFDGLQYITVESPTSKSIKLDKIFKEPGSSSCHLVDSQNKISGLLDGYKIDLNADVIEKDKEYTVTFVYDSPEKNISKKIFLTQPPEGESAMKSYLAELEEVDGSKDSFKYNWSRQNDFVAEGDLYVYFPAHQGSSHRVNIEAGKTEVAAQLDNDVVQIFHSAFDPYGRVIMNYYVSADDTPLK